MIIKERSLYRKFIDWWDSGAKSLNIKYKTRIPGFWENQGKGSPGFILIVFIVFFLTWYFDPVWRPFLHYYIPDYIPLLEYDPYTP